MSLIRKNYCDSKNVTGRRCRVGSGHEGQHHWYNKVGVHERWDDEVVVLPSVEDVPFFEEEKQQL